MFAQIHQRTMPTKQKQYILPEVFLHLLSLCPQQNQNHCCILTKKSGVAYQQDYLILAITLNSWKADFRVGHQSNV